ncbi:MAG: BTAD domain-containing putative transcriptional regulator [Mycobacteriales bacterium]
MEFRVLGPLEITHHGKAAPVGGVKQRAILAALLLRANQTVTPGQLAGSAWVEPPQALASNLRTYVSRLRAAFVAVGEDGARLLTESNGYRLVVHPGELDLAVFEALVAEADGLPAGDVAGIADRLGQAIRLWRGDVLADVAVGPLLETEVARLEDLRLTVTERWADAALAAGRHEDVAVELGGAIRAHPLRERLREQYMVALYRCGRQAEALECYRQAFQLFDSELGIAPGKALERLHGQILAADPELDAAPPAPPAPVPVAVAAPTAAPPRRTFRFRRPRAILIAATVVVVSLLGAGTAWTLASADPRDRPSTGTATTGRPGPPGGWVRVHPVTAPGLCLADGLVRDHRYDSFVAVQRPCDQTAPMRTYLEPMGGDRYRVQWHHPEYGTGCLTVLTGGRPDGLLEPRDNCAQATVFHVRPAGRPGTWVFQVDGHGCVGIRDADSAAGAEALMGRCGAAGQAFTIEPAP